MNVIPVPIFSGALYRRLQCFVYVPPSYEADAEKRYPVVYLLHGMHGSESDWWMKGQAPQTIQGLIEKGELPPSIVVMPSDGGYGLGTFYLNWYNGAGHYEDYMVHDVIPYIDSHFRTIPERSARSIGGLSMGGFGAVMLALKHPNLFSSCASLSGALGDIAYLPYEQFRRGNWAELLGPQNGEYAKQYSLFRLAMHRVQEKNAPWVYMDCGRDDSLFEMNTAFHQYLDKIGLPHTFIPRDGAHNWDYWKTHLSEALRGMNRQANPV
jgi:putative tributyrin esterase